MVTEARYRDMVPLGGGPAQTALAAVDSSTGAACALKLLPRPPDRRTRSGIEATLAVLARLRDDAPLLVADRLEEFEPGRWALRMELCSQSLVELVDSFGPLSPPDVGALGLALAQALAAAHQAGVVHGSVAPGNVVFRPSGEALLSDFGLALRHAYPADPTGYTAPETVRDAVADERTDLYGLGAVLYLAATGRAPYRDVTGVLQQPLNPIDRDDLSPGLTRLVTELLAKDPHDRPVDATAVVARLEEPGRPPSAVDEPVIALPSGPPIIEFGPAPRSRRPLLTGVAVAIVVVLTGVAALVVVAHQRGRLSDAASVSGSSAASPAVSATASQAPAVHLEMTEVVDRGNTVQLSWRSSRQLYFAVIVAEEGSPAHSIVVKNATTYEVAVDPVRRYCFEIQGTDGTGIYSSAPRPIRGATCSR